MAIISVTMQNNYTERAVNIYNSGTGAMWICIQSLQHIDDYITHMLDNMYGSGVDS